MDRIKLPKGTPVKENIDPGKINLPEALAKLKVGNFTGYLRFDSTNGLGILIFEKGQMISAHFQGDREEVIAYDAIARVFEEALLGGSVLNIYRLGPELAMSIHALLHGEVLYRGQELKLLDIKAFLGKIREDRLNGCLRIYTEDRTALIFYEGGNALGFFHDGARDIETTAENALSLTKMPGAKIDLLSTRSLSDLMRVDLVESGDLDLFWEKAKEIIKQRANAQAKEVASKKKITERERIESLQASLREKVGAYIGRIGIALLDKEFDALNRKGDPLDQDRFNAILDQLAKGAKMVAGPAKISEMLEAIKHDARPWFKNT